MIRATFHIDPATLSQDEWAQRFTEAVWIENKRLEGLAKVLAAMFATGEDN